MSKIANVSRSPNVDLTTSGPLSFCIGDSVVISAVPSSRYSYQWYKGGVSIAGATGRMYSAKTARKYYVVVTDTILGCSRFSSKLTVTTPCRLKEMAQVANVSIAVAPNPVETKAMITVKNGQSGNAVLKIVDISGRIVISQNISVTSDMEQVFVVPVEELESGIYMVQLMNGSNNPSVRITVAGH
ncbi:MAG: T9SS type A sorting domain-containing protein [Bacteroidetes bacterium]|nr:T9SS type A sorting domain-containing protein [Bacteroidota bacterium]